MSFKKQADPYGRGSYCVVVAMHGDKSREAEVLRSFRDEFLKKMPAGEKLVNIYYRASPEIVEFAESSKLFSRFFSYSISAAAKVGSFAV